MEDQPQLVREPAAADRDVLTKVAAEPVAPPSPPRRRRRWAMLAVIAGSGLVAASITLGPTGWRMYSQKDATLSTPAQAAGLTLDTSAQATTTAEDLRSVVAARFDLDGTVGAIYNDPGAPSRTVLLVGGTGFLRKPGAELDLLFALLDDTAGGVTAIHEVPAGPLNGVLKCGSADSSEGALAVCGWADHGSLLLGLFPGRGVDDSARVLRDLRGDIQHRP